MIKTFILIIALFLLVGCASSVSEPVPSNTIAPTDLPTSTPTPTPEPTPTPAPLEGRLFFDMNGSGLKDEASFNYDAERLIDERQPLQADLLAAIEAYVAGHPELKDGDLITLEEPGLSGYSVCAKSNCVTTDAEGKFQLVEPNVDRFLNISIKDPNAGTPALEMRYVNKWRGEVTVPEYTKDIEASTMEQLTAVPGCEVDAAALVCIQDADTLLVREQHLNDTSIFKLGDGATIQPSNPNEIGLMQGFLTLPFDNNKISTPYIINYFDIIGKRSFDEAGITTYFNSQDGIMLNYDGKYTRMFSPTIYNGTVPNPGVGDSHTGQDYFITIGSLIISSSPTSSVWYLANQDGELRVDISFINPDNHRNNYSTDYGHLAIQLVKNNQTVYRGQIIGLSGDSGTYSGKFPQLHFNLQESFRNGWNYIDMYRYIVSLNPLPTNFWGSDVSYWVSDNNPTYSQVTDLRP